jgi:murein DD-endopeptidase MepM/ murein hydrolase activator NlpD
VNDENEQNTGSDPETVPGPKGDLASMRRVSRLRDGMRENRDLKYLLDDRDLVRSSSSSRKPWVMLTTAAGSVLALGAVVLFAFMPGSSSPKAAPPSQDVAAIASATNQPASGTTPGASATATATATIARPTPAPGEGSASGAVPPAKVTVSAPGFASPVKVKPQVTDSFGAPRGDGRYHSGVDLVSATSAQFDVVSSCAGSVAGADHSDTLGDFVVVDCGNSWRTVYGQMGTISVKQGDSVRAGQSVLGRESGFLHFEIRWNNTAVNPEAYIDFKAAAADTPTPEPTATNTPSPTNTPTRPGTAPSGPAPTSPGSSGGTGAPPPTGTNPPPTATPTEVPPTATPTATPVPPTPTPRPTATPTPRPRSKVTPPGGPVVQ